MHDVVFSEDSQSCNQLTEDGKCFFLLERSLLFEEVVESASLAVLIDEIAIIFGLEQLVEPDDVGTGL